MNSFGQFAVRVAIPLAIIGGGLVAQKALIATKKVAEAKPASDLGATVRTEKVVSSSELVTVAAQGTVVAAREVMLQPEVQGRVVFANKALVPGGRFKKGEVLLRVDASEYALRAKQSASEVEQAQQQVKLERSRGEIAQQEWKLIGEDELASDSGRAVALRKPQMKEAEARMKLAQHSRDLAVLTVGRTTLKAPFNGIVKTGQVNVGQYISPQASLATLVGSDEYWVQVSIPVAELNSIKVPGFNTTEDEGSKVSVWQEIGDERIEREGQVVRLFGDVDPMGRMARVLVEIVDPLGLEHPEAERGLPLLLGAYVHLDIKGQEMMDVVEIPRSALHSGRFIYVYGPDDRLQVREVKIAWRRPTSLLLSSGIKAGEEIITSRLGTPIDGLKLRRADADAVGSRAQEESSDPDEGSSDKHAKVPAPAHAAEKEAIQ